MMSEAWQRVVEGQRLIQATSDVLLGRSRWHAEGGEPIDFYRRQRELYRRRSIENSRVRAEYREVT